MNDVLEMMDDFIDPSDPDVDDLTLSMPNQTPISIRKRET